MRKLVFLMLVVIIVGTLYIVKSITKPNYNSILNFFGTSTNVQTQPININPDFTLTDVNGKIVTNNDFLGKIMLVYFGFTYCPDICPAELNVIGAALEKLGEDADKVQALFITVDPERDDFAQLKSYMEHFNTKIIALNGTLEETEIVAKNYKVYYNKIAGQGDGKNYLIDHSSLIYLIDTKGNFNSVFYAKATADDIALKLKQLITNN
ncbi:MAG: SCO family protein [Alphaproteobacteria bacterium]